MKKAISSSYLSTETKNDFTITKIPCWEPSKWSTDGLMKDDSESVYCRINHNQIFFQFSIIGGLDNSGIPAMKKSFYINYKTSEEAKHVYNTIKKKSEHIYLIEEKEQNRIRSKEFYVLPIECKPRNTIYDLTKSQIIEAIKNGRDFLREDIGTKNNIYKNITPPITCSRALSVPQFSEIINNKIIYRQCFVYKTIEINANGFKNYTKHSLEELYEMNKNIIFDFYKREKIHHIFKITFVLQNIVDDIYGGEIFIYGAKKYEK